MPPDSPSSPDSRVAVTFPHRIDPSSGMRTGRAGHGKEALQAGGSVGLASCPARPPGRSCRPLDGLLAGSARVRAIDRVRGGLRSVPFGQAMATMTKPVSSSRSSTARLSAKYLSRDAASLGGESHRGSGGGRVASAQRTATRNPGWIDPARQAVSRSVPERQRLSESGHAPIRASLHRAA